MNLTEKQKRVCEQILNAFETGSARGDYSNISIFDDGPNGIRQITYGRSQTTEYGNLAELVEMYVKASGSQSELLRPFVERIGHAALVDDLSFKRLLREAGRDPVMQRTQDQFFDKRYFLPAWRWAESNGFEEALSMLVIYDSFIHSGGILGLLRSRFPERPPSLGGSERTWISQYLEVRHKWLANHARAVLRKTIYRTTTMRNEIERGNWDLSLLPIVANGVRVDGDDFATVPTESGSTAAAAGAERAAPPFLGDPFAHADVTVVTTGTTGLVNLERICRENLAIEQAELGRGGDLSLVRQIQERLVFFGFLDPPVDGIFGPVSSQALDAMRAYASRPDGDVIDAKLATLLLDPDPDRFLPVALMEDLASRIFLCMHSLGYFVSRLPGHLNIIYLEGTDADGTPNGNQPNRFNDRRLLLGIVDGRPTLLGNWEATTEPGRHYTLAPLSPKGAARIALGQQKAWSVGTHRGSHEALVQVAPVKVYRDLNQDFEREGDRLYEGMFGINQHWGYDLPVNDIGRASAGCLVGRSEAGHRQFMSLLKSDPRYQASHGYRFLTTVITAEALRRQTGGD